MILGSKVGVDLSAGNSVCLDLFLLPGLALITFTSAIYFFYNGCHCLPLIIIFPNTTNTELDYRMLY